MNAKPSTATTIVAPNDTSAPADAAAFLVWLSVRVFQRLRGTKAQPTDAEISAMRSIAETAARDIAASSVVHEARIIRNQAAADAAATEWLRRHRRAGLVDESARSRRTVVSSYVGDWRSGRNNLLGGF